MSDRFELGAAICVLTIIYIAFFLYFRKFDNHE